jgi:GT2 family glycosyltransferase
LEGCPQNFDIKRETIVSARVLVCIVTYNSSRHLEACLESLQLQTFHDYSIAVWDNASTDETPAIVAGHRDSMSFTHLSDTNIGFSAAQNRLIKTVTSDYVLVLNADVVLDSGFLQNLVGRLDRDSSSGSATGKLLRQTKDSGPARRTSDRKILDSTGIYITPNQRHFDRGSNEADLGQYEESEYVFGASGAAALYRRKMLEDIREGTEYFDESFFAYREDVDLAWRAQWMGWRCLYVPEAIAYHARRVLPENRSTLPDAINMHSFKNRFLLRVKNMDWGTYARFFFPIAFRDAAALGYVTLREWASLPGIPKLLRALPRALACRKSLRSRRRATAKEIRSWFSYTPVSKPIQIRNSKFEIRN